MDKSDKKRRICLTLREDTYEDVKGSYRKDQCTSYNQFMERAIIYYLGYVNSENMLDYLSPTIMSSLKAASDENTTRITRILFKLAVEIAVMNNLYAASLDIDKEQIATLRQECEKEVRKLNGDFSLSDAIRWQKR